MCSKRALDGCVTDPNDLVLLEVTGYNLEVVKVVDRAYVGPMRVVEGIKILLKIIFVTLRSDVEFRSMN